MGILENKVALITGTGGGIGGVAALSFAREGPGPILTPASDRDLVDGGATAW